MAERVEGGGTNKETKKKRTNGGEAFCSDFAFHPAVTKRKHCTHFHACTTAVFFIISNIEKSTRYGLDGPGIKSPWGRGFLHPSRLALELIQPLV